MFNGIVESRGGIRSVESLDGGARRFTIEPLSGGERFLELSLGESVAVNGACLTVAHKDKAAFSSEVILPTLEKTNLGDLKAGDYVNLERSLRMGDRIGGHFVTGHVDATGTVRSVRTEGETRFLTIDTSPDMLEGLIPQGAVTVDGISLTIAALEDNHFVIGIIPHTWEYTNIHARKPGDRVNLELDVIGKYVYKYASSCSNKHSSITKDFLEQQGFLT